MARPEHLLLDRQRPAVEGFGLRGLGRSALGLAGRGFGHDGRLGFRGSLLDCDILRLFVVIGYGVEGCSLRRSGGRRLTGMGLLRDRRTPFAIGGSICPGAGDCAVRN